MRPTVRSVFYDFNLPMEGAVNHLYQDVKGLVSIGVGHLVDPVASAVHLPLKREDGSLASRDEIVAEWARVKGEPSFARLGHRAAQQVTRLHLTKEDLLEMLLRKLDANDVYLSRRFPEMGEWPADAQLAVHSLSWACGPAFRFPLLAAALQRQDFTVASVECHMDVNSEGVYNPGIIPRNTVNRMLFRNAAYVAKHDLDRAVLHWPKDIELSTDDEVTQPSFPIVHASPFQEPDDEPPEAA